LACTDQPASTVALGELGVAPQGRRCDVAPRAHGCGQATATIGVEGGVITAPSGLSVMIPFGALDQPTTITVTATTSPPPRGVGALSPVYQFEPDGLVFNRPVTVNLPLPAGVKQASIYWSRLGQSGFDPIGGTIANGGISAQTPHFSQAVVG